MKSIREKKKLKNKAEVTIKHRKIIQKRKEKTEKNKADETNKK